MNRPLWLQYRVRIGFERSLRLKIFLTPRREIHYVNVRRHCLAGLGRSAL